MKPIPSPTGLPGFGTMLSLLSAGGASKLHLYVDKRHKELGPIYRDKIGPVSGVFIADGDYARKVFGAEGKHPEHVVPEPWLLYNKIYNCKRGIFFMNGEEWLTFRKALNNVMLKVPRNDFYVPVKVVADTLVDKWKGNSKIVNLEKQMYKWSLEVVIAILSGWDNYLTNKSDMEPTIDELSDAVHGLFVESASMSLMPAKIVCKLNLPVWKRFVRAAGSAVELGKKITEKIVQLEEKTPGKESLISKLLDSGLKPEDISRVVTDLILGAGDTTALAMQWFLYCLSMDQPTQNMLYEEIKIQSYMESHRSPLLEGAFREALRLYPVAPFITRILPKHLVLDDYCIEAQELVLMSLYTMGRNENYFPEAESFSPGRWLKRDKNSGGVAHRGAFLPFASGARSCVGRKIAETQILVTASKILEKYIIKPGNEKKIEMKLHLVSVPSEPIVLNLEERKYN